MAMMMMFIRMQGERERERVRVLFHFFVLFVVLSASFFECKQCKATNGSLLTATAKDE